MVQDAGMDAGPREPYYRADLARVHHEGFAFHADGCAPGILELLEPVRASHGLVVELGCGSGLLTRHLVEAGHRVVATDASPAMLDLARGVAPAAESIERLVLPNDPIPSADAIVSVGHALNYLPDEASIEAALIAIAEALRPGGVLAIDLCDLDYGEARGDAPEDRGWISDDWALVTSFSRPTPDRFIRQMAIFTRGEGGAWRRDDERHDNVLIDTSTVPDLLEEHGVHVELVPALGGYRLPEGLCAVLGGRDEAGT
jgi:SAM-dependent methyltransferase